jgi:hypothetical protein
MGKTHANDEVERATSGKERASARKSFMGTSSRARRHNNWMRDD